MHMSKAQFFGSLLKKGIMTAWSDLGSGRAVVSTKKKSGADPLSESGMKRVSGGAARPRDRALARPRRVVDHEELLEGREVLEVDEGERHHPAQEEPVPRAVPLAASDLRRGSR